MSYGITFPPIQLAPIEEKGRKVEYSYQALGLEMQAYYPPVNRPRLWALFFKHDERKIRDAFLTVQKKFYVTQEEKYKSFNYLCGVIKNLK